MRATRSRGRFAVTAFVGACTLGAFTVPITHANAAPVADDPTRPILAVVSPEAAPACSAAGTATLLVPIVGGFVDSQLKLGGAVSVGTVVLDALGPVYVTCGSLPSSPGTRCQLDNQIVGVLNQVIPDQAKIVVGAPPNVIGSQLDTLNAGLALLGVSPLDALQSALQCDIVKPPGAVDAPPPPPAGPLPLASPRTDGASPSHTGSVTGVGSTGRTTLSEATGVPTASGTLPRAGTPQTIADIITHHIPGWLTVLQLLVAAFLVLFLSGSWLTAARAARSSGL